MTPCFVIVLATVSSVLPPVSFTHEAMGTLFEIKVYPTPALPASDLERIAQEAFAIIDKLEQELSTWRPDSEVISINRHAADGPVPVSKDLLDLLGYCRRYYEKTDGAFDPTVGPLLEVWGFYRKEGRVPSKSELASALECVGMDKVIVDERKGTVRFSHRYMRLDFGGIGKGWAIDRAAEILRNHQITSAILSAGSSTILAIGAPPGDEAWSVFIRNPHNESVPLGEVNLKDASLSTSGCYENFLEVDGKKYCHILNPKTGLPVEGMLSATAIAATATETDALSTAFFVIGDHKTKEFCRKNPVIRAILVPPEERKSP